MGAAASKRVPLMDHAPVFEPGPLGLNKVRVVPRDRKYQPGTSHRGDEQVAPPE